MEPAVGLGCILGPTRREWEEDKEKQKRYIRTSKYTSSMVASQQEKALQARLKKTKKNTVVTFLLFKRPQSPAG